MEGLSEDAVDFRDNYDGSLREPVVLPASFPNILANGASGIAVGMATSIPPHNVGELCDAALHLIKAPNARDETLLDLVPAPDFPTGGILVEPRESLLEAYRTGRGSFRLRARWEVEHLPRGQWQVVVTEIPYQVQKSRLIERIAELIQARKIPVLSDVRDESADDVRLVLEPRARTVDSTVLMEMLFRQCDLETRISLNMNVLIDGRTPKVCSLKEVLRAFLDHRRDVLLRRSRHRYAQIDHRLEVLEGYLVAFLNLDEVIRIIRNEDEPKPVLAETFDLSDVQAEAILNMRLRSLRRLEEMELRKEEEKLHEERLMLEDLLASEDLQWRRISGELRETQRKFGADAAGGARRTGFGEAPAIEEMPPEAMIEREPVSVVCSAMGWIRAIKGHVALDHELKYRDGDGKRFVLHAETTDRLVLVGTNGRFYTISCKDLPGGRGMGEPVRLMVDLPNEADAAALFVHRPGPPAPRGHLGRQRLPRPGGQCPRTDPQREAGGQPRRGRDAPHLPGGRRRSRRLRRGEPQGSRLSGHGAARTRPGARRAVAEVRNRRALGRGCLQAGVRAELEGPRRPHPYREKPVRLDRSAPPTPKAFSITLTTKPTHMPSSVDFGNAQRALNAASNVSAIMSAAIAMRKTAASASFKMNTPTGTPAMPAAAIGSTCRAGMCRRVCHITSANMNSDTVLISTTAVCGSSSRSSSGIEVTPMPNPTVQNTSAPTNTSAAASKVCSTERVSKSGCPYCLHGITEPPVPRKRRCISRCRRRTCPFTSTYGMPVGNWQGSS